MMCVRIPLQELSAGQLLGALRCLLYAGCVSEAPRGWTMDQEKIPFEPCCPDCPQN
jgi:hypothetical protein